MHFTPISLCALSALSSHAAAFREGSGPQKRLVGHDSFGTPGVHASFDYIIVGGGTAGLTVASRLAEDPSLSVAVIEAGGFYEADAPNTSVVPGYAMIYAGTDPKDTNPLVDWGFVTVPQAGANMRRMHYARGKTLGGSSARNDLYYHRQTLGSSRKWATEVGDLSYTFSKITPYYEKSVHYTAPNIPYPNTTNEQDAAAFSAQGGPLQVSFGSYNDPFATWVLPALRAIGQTAINGFQSGKLIGCGYVPETINPTDASRSSSESSFLQSALKNTTIKVYNNTLAQKILFTGNTATGVIVSSAKPPGISATEYVLSARKELIISAGAFQSPQLLMVSGIGPRQTLESLGIPLLKELRGVGQNLWDQVWYGTSFRVNVLTNSAGLNDPALAAAAVQEYVQSASGPLSVAGSGTIGFEKLPTNIRSTLSNATQRALDDAFPRDWPDIEFLPASGVIGNQSNYAIQDPRDGYNYGAIATSLVAPLSRGNITINSRLMSDPPLINPNWLTHPADIELAIAAFKRQRQLWTHLTNLTIGQEQIPGPSIQTDGEILDFIRGNLAPIWHAAATCKMGKASDEMAVVDSRMRVFGIQGLRVVDASSFPFLPPGHPQATVYALAEKVADDILRGQAGVKGKV